MRFELLFLMEIIFLEFKLFCLKLEPFRLRHLPLLREGTFLKSFNQSYRNRCKELKLQEL